MSSTATYQKKIEDLVRRHRVAKEHYKAEKRALLESEEVLSSTHAALEVLQQIAQTVQEEAHHRIADVVSKCLAAVFDDPYIFVIKFVKRRSRTEAELYFERGGQKIDPTTAAGGGVVDVAAFALRLACLCLQRPAPKRLLVLDEPFRFVSQNYQERVREMLETLAREMGVQFVLVTHEDELHAGTVISLTA